MALSRSKGKSSGVLARRRAALERAAVRMAEERRAAEEAEAERRRKEAAFDELVADFELAREDEKAVVAEVEAEVRRVRELGQVRIDAARVAAARVVLAMGEAGETVGGCGHRLGVGAERVKELRRLGREALATEGAAEESAAKAAPEKDSAAGGPGPAAGAGRRAGDGGRGAAGAGVSPVGGAGSAPVGAPLSPPLSPPAGPIVAPGPAGGARSGWPEASG